MCEGCQPVLPSAQHVLPCCAPGGLRLGWGPWLGRRVWGGSGGLQGKGCPGVEGQGEAMWGWAKPVPK